MGELVISENMSDSQLELLVAQALQLQIKRVKDEMSEFKDDLEKLKKERDIDKKEFNTTIDKVIYKTNSDFDELKSLLGLNDEDWRDSIKKYINVIVKKSETRHQVIWTEFYNTFDKRFGKNLNLQLENMKERMYREGIAKSIVKKVNRLDVISKKKDLRELAVKLILEMCARYKVNTKDLN